MIEQKYNPLDFEAFTTKVVVNDYLVNLIINHGYKNNNKLSLTSNKIEEYAVVPELKIISSTKRLKSLGFKVTSLSFTEFKEKCL